MVHLEVHQAQLLRMLAALFGEDQLLVNLSLRMVIDSCEDMQQAVREGVCSAAGSPVLDTKCLFTIVNGNDRPQLVVDFSGFGESYIDAAALKQNEAIERVLAEAGIKCLFIHPKDFQAILDKDAETTLVSVLQGLLDDKQPEDAG
jgi:hypothetical protein